MLFLISYMCARLVHFLQITVHVSQGQGYLSRIPNTFAPVDYVYVCSLIITLFSQVVLVQLKTFQLSYMCACSSKLTRFTDGPGFNTKAVCHAAIARYAARCAIRGASSAASCR